MNVSCQSVINPERPVQGAADLKKAGIDSVVVYTGVALPMIDAKPEALAREIKGRPETIRERFRALLEKARESNIRIAAIYAPYASNQNKKIRDYLPFMERCAAESIELCKMAGSHYVIIEPVYTERGKEREVNHDYYRKLAPKAREYGIQILLKNQFSEVGGHLVRGICAEARTAAEWVDGLNREAGQEIFGFCVDTGVCNLCGNDMQAYITGLGQRVKAVILRECDGHSNASMLPFTDSSAGTDWLGVIRGLRDIDFDGELIVNFSGTVGAFSMLLRPPLYRLAKEIADFFRWQIELERNMKKYQSIALFGAGNMCRNYMKNYGEKYPPLFTCDNNPRLWGTEFCGLEVRNPEALKSLPEGCGIFICNTFYREIEAQLKEMGIENNIEYFNDEYLQSFYFDRFEREE